MSRSPTAEKKLQGMRKLATTRIIIFAVDSARYKKYRLINNPINPYDTNFENERKQMENIDIVWFIFDSPLKSCVYL
jgi:hypothetical protein